jgi:hypothetical protein
MAITQADAARALADIERTEARGRDANCYRGSSATLILWGAVWMVAYTANGLLPPDQWPLVWIPANLIGLAGTLYLCRTARPTKTPGTTTLVVLAGVLFITALYLVDPPHSAAQGQVLPPLLIAFIYTVLGANRLRRFCLIGAGLFAATLFGFFVLPHIFAFWMAATGSLALISSGLWLRSA